MQAYNLLLIFDQDLSHVLMCMRRKPPFAGKYNLIGGKVEPGEEALHAAYREMTEESGYTADDITLYPLMTTQYLHEGYELQVYYGRMQTDKQPIAELNPLEWISLDNDFFNCERFAGNGVLGHYILESKHFLQN